MSSNNNSDPTAFLIADLEHFGESLWRNEEVGERRVSFFITLVTAVMAGLVALYKVIPTAILVGTAEELAAGKLVRANTVGFFQTVTVASIVGLIFFGIVTYLRMLQRNRVTDQHKDTCGHIRKQLLLLNPTIASYQVPAKPRSKALWRVAKGGLTETVAALIALLSAGLTHVLLIHFQNNWSGGGTVYVAMGVGSLVLALLVWFAKHQRPKATASDSGLELSRKYESLPPQYYRAGVGAVVYAADNRVLAIERTDFPGAMQLPQGGLRISEEPLQAVLREIEEETSIAPDMIELIGKPIGPLSYDVPIQCRNHKVGRGQVQYWYRFRFVGMDKDIDVTRSSEATEWTWITADELVLGAAAFRKDVYRRVLEV